MKHLDRRRKGQNGRPDMAVWVEFMNSKNLTLSIISGGFPHNLNEEEVRWLVGVLQETLGEKQHQAESSSSPASIVEEPYDLFGDEAFQREFYARTGVPYAQRWREVGKQMEKLHGEGSSSRAPEESGS